MAAEIPLRRTPFARYSSVAHTPPCKPLPPIPCSLSDLLRKYPDRAASVIPSLHRTLKRMDNASGKAAVIWMLGEFGHLIDDAPYLLEPLIDALGSGETESDSVRCELLAATVKLFFKRPPGEWSRWAAAATIAANVVSCSSSVLARPRPTTSPTSPLPPPLLPAPFPAFSSPQRSSA